MGDVIREMSERKEKELLEKIEILKRKERELIEKGKKYDNDYEEAKALIDQIIGYFQFKGGEYAQKGIKHMYKLRWIVKKNMKNFQ